MRPRPCAQAGETSSLQQGSGQGGSPEGVGVRAEGPSWRGREIPKLGPSPASVPISCP